MVRLPSILDRTFLFWPNYYTSFSHYDQAFHVWTWDLNEWSVVMAIYYTLRDDTGCTCQVLLLCTIFGGMDFVWWCGCQARSWLWLTFAWVFLKTSLHRRGRTTTMLKKEHQSSRYIHTHVYVRSIQTQEVVQQVGTFLLLKLSKPSTNCRKLYH